jgi:hypothetical protein
MDVITTHGFTGKEVYGAKSIKALGLPLFDVFVARSKKREIQILMEGDRADVLAEFGCNK